MSKGERAGALALARNARDISEETGPGFVGPIIRGLLAVLEESPDAQEAALAAGEALLARGSVGHNHFWFRRFTIERALLAGNWSEAEKQADALLLRMADEPLPYASMIAERGRALARRGRGQATEADEAALTEALSLAASFDMRIGALGEALRRI